MTKTMQEQITSIEMLCRSLLCPGNVNFLNLPEDAQVDLTHIVAARGTPKRTRKTAHTPKDER